MPFIGRGRADDHSNHNKRPAAAVQCNGGLCSLPVFVTELRKVNAAVRQRDRADRAKKCVCIEGGRDAARLRRSVTSSRDEAAGDHDRNESMLED